VEGVAPARCTPYLSCLYLYAPVLLCFSLSLSLSLSLSALNLSLLVFPSLSLYLPLSLSLSRPLPLFDLLFKQSRLHCLDVGLTWYLWHIKLRWQYLHRQWRRHPGTLPYPTCCVYLCACLPVSTIQPNPVRESGLSHDFCWVGGQFAISTHQTVHLSPRPKPIRHTRHGGTPFVGWG